MKAKKDGISRLFCLQQIFCLKKGSIILHRRVIGKFFFRTLMVFDRLRRIAQCVTAAYKFQQRAKRSVCGLIEVAFFRMVAGGKGGFIPKSGFAQFVFFAENSPQSA